jgi:PAS domain S-box-containing protein
MDGPSGHATEGLELLDVGVAIFDKRSRLVFANKAFRKLRRYPKKVCRKGVTLKELLRFNAERGDFGTGKPDKLVAERLAEIEKAERREIEREMADGQTLRITYRRTPSGGLVITFEDRTAERRAEAALKASEERYALVSEAAEEAIYEWDIAGDRFYASPRLANLLGREFAESGERPWNWTEIIHPDDLRHYRKTLAKHLSGKEQRWSCEYRLKDTAGEWRWVSDHGTSIRGKKGKAVRMVAAIRDITERVEKDAALAKSEERHALVTSATADGIYDWNVAGDELYVSDNLKRILDFDFEVSASGMWAERVHPEDYNAYRDAIRAYFRGKTDALECEYRVRGARGDYRWIQDRAIGVRGSDGRVIRLVGAARDVTELRDARAEIQRTEGRLLSSLATISDGILLVDSEHRVQLWNDRYYQIFSEAAGGADLGNVIVKGRLFEDMVRDGYNMGAFKLDPDGVDAWVANRMRAWDRPAAQWEFELANGAWILLNERQMPDGGRVSVYTDITEFKQREQEAQAARQRFEEAIEAISSGFALWDAEDRLVVSNARYRDYFAELSDIVVPGARFNEIIAAGIERGLFPLSEGDVKGYLAGIAEKRKNAIGETREQHIGGAWLQITDHRTRDGGIVSIYTDITELKNKQVEIERQTAILEETLQNMGQGITMVDKDLKVVAYNRKFLELMEWPEDRFGVGFGMEDAFRFNAERGEYGPGDVEEQVRERVELAKKFLPHQFERIRPDGTVIEIVGNPIEGGGMVATYPEAAMARIKAEVDRLTVPFRV